MEAQQTCSSRRLWRDVASSYTHVKLPDAAQVRGWCRVLHREDRRGFASHNWTPQPSPGGGPRGVSGSRVTMHLQERTVPRETPFFF